MRNLERTQDEATELMLMIHFKGGMLIPLPTAHLAKEVARIITEEARKAGHHLVCRAVDAQQHATSNAQSLGHQSSGT